MAEDKEKKPKGFRSIQKLLAAGLTILGSQAQLRSEEQETEYHGKPEIEIHQVCDRRTAQKSNDLGSFLQFDCVESNAGDDAEHIYAAEEIRRTEHYRTAREALQHAYAESNSPGTPTCTNDVRKEIESLEAELTAQFNSNDVYSGRTLELAKKLFAYKLAVEDAAREDGQTGEEKYSGIFDITPKEKGE
ncbi:hypothetical protein KY338_06630 [Candidatus Woesearchaeota archaeon]|nr:hypothetical protein [Candidatus Woesearchaeota archaeon]MBW3006398.1 hypothetical protein [Candidatus Woesearchaeota archaeon]